jgi:hypothetical protein
MVNRHAGTFHRVRLERWTHKDSRKPLDPLTGTKVWQIIGGPMFESPSEHKVRDHKKYGRYTFDARFDGVLFDPELIVDPPPPRPPKKPRAAGAAKAAGKAKKGKAGGAKKKKSGKASRSARRAKKGKPRKAGRSAGKRR